MDQSTVIVAGFGHAFCFPILSRDGNTAVMRIGGYVAADMIDLAKELDQWIPAQIDGVPCHIRVLDMGERLENPFGEVFHVKIEIRAVTRTKLSVADIIARLESFAGFLQNPGHIVIANRVLALRDRLSEFESSGGWRGDFRDIPNVKAELQALYDSTPKFKAGPLKEFVDKLCMLIAQLDSAN